MIEFQHTKLNNGLNLIVHEDHTVPIAVFNIMYDVGSKDEQPELTGIAHLYEHMMFSGTKNVMNFDRPVHDVGGNCNAFTSPDLTNYYVSLPSENIETAFWLESDRMINSEFSRNALEVQQKVVKEEYMQRYRNQPYGDLWALIRALVYKEHPYRYPTIGRDIDHVRQTTLADLSSFSKQFYQPGNAVLVISGNVNAEEMKSMAEKWFGDIPDSKRPVRNLTAEPEQTITRRKEIFRDVPLDMFVRTYPMCERLHPDYQTANLLSDVLGNGKASRLYKTLVLEKELFNSVGAHVSGSHDPGMFIISGQVKDSVDIQTAEEAVNHEIKTLLNEGVRESEIEKAKNQAESALVTGQIQLMNRAVGLAESFVLGEPDMLNNEPERIRKVSKEGVEHLASELLKDSKSNTLLYRAEKNRP